MDSPTSQQGPLSPTDTLTSKSLSPKANEVELQLKNALNTIRDQNTELDRAAQYRYQINSEKQELIHELSHQKQNLQLMLDEVWSPNSDSEDFRRRPLSVSNNSVRYRQSLRRASTNYQPESHQRLFAAQREVRDLNSRLDDAELRAAELQENHQAAVQGHQKHLRKLEHKFSQCQQTLKNTQKTVDMLHEERERLIQRHNKELKNIRDRADREVVEIREQLALDTARHEQQLNQQKKRHSQLEAQLRMVQMQKCSLEEDVHQLANEFTDKVSRIEELEQLVEIGEQYRQQYEEQTEAMQALQAELEDSRARLQMRLTPQASPANSFVGGAAPTGNNASFIRSEYPFVEVSDDEYIQSRSRGTRRRHNRGEPRLMRHAVTQQAKKTLQGGGHPIKVSFDESIREIEDGPSFGSGKSTCHPLHMALTDSASLQSQKEVLQRETERIIQALGTAIASRSKAILKGPLNSWGRAWMSRSRSTSQPPTMPSDLEPTEDQAELPSDDKSSALEDIKNPTKSAFPPISAPAKLGVVDNQVVAPAPSSGRANEENLPIHRVSLADEPCPSPPPGGFRFRNECPLDDELLPGDSGPEFGEVLSASVMAYALTAEDTQLDYSHGGGHLRRRPLRSTDSHWSDRNLRQRRSGGRQKMASRETTDTPCYTEHHYRSNDSIFYQSFTGLGSVEEGGAYAHEGKLDENSDLDLLVDDFPVDRATQRRLLAEEMGASEPFPTDCSDNDGSKDYSTTTSTTPLTNWLLRMPLLKVAKHLSMDSPLNTSQPDIPGGHQDCSTPHEKARRNESLTLNDELAMSHLEHARFANTDRPLASHHASTARTNSPSAAQSLGARALQRLSTYERLMRSLARLLTTLYRWFKFICFLLCGFTLVLLEGPNGNFGKRYIS
ncbi:hypothetical protein IWQ61_001703 [Dispira simplex]|nr:hypothetical protein IWQ61_001703 [Dispira simplex]